MNHAIALLLLLALHSGAHATESMPDDIRRALSLGHYDIALPWLQSHAGPTDAESARLLGNLHRLGQGVARDDAQARHWFAIAAQAGDTDGQYLYATLLERDDPHAAAQWLERAARDGHRLATKRLERLRRTLADANRSGPACNTLTNTQDPSEALIDAIRRERPDALKPLLDCGASPDAQDALGNHALQLAAARGADWLKPLVDAGADVKTTDASGATALHRAVARDDTAAAALLLRHAAPRGARDAQGWTPASLARRRAVPAMVALFPETVARTPAATDPDSALMHAVRTGNADLLRASLARVANEPVDAQGLTPLELAVQLDKPDLVATLAKHRYPTPAAAGHTANALRLSMTHASAACALALLAAGVRDDGTTPLLTIAARHNQPALVTSLLAAGSPAQQADEEGHTPLWWAARNGMADSVPRLLGALPAEARTDAALAALRVALGREQTNVVSALVGNVDVNARGPEGGTLLMQAAAAADPALTRLLLDAMPELDARDRHDDTALIIAVRANRPANARLLLDAGASPTLRNNRDESARTLMARREESDWQQLLAGTRSELGAFLGRLAN